MKREKRRRREWERWRGERVDSEEWQARARGRPMPVLSVWCLKVRSTGSETGLLTRNICCFDFTFTSFSSSLSVVALRCSHSAPHPLSPRLPTSFSFHPPILHQLIWHIPALIVQAEPLALFKICIRMLFLYSSKRRHVESLLNCSANRWRFSRCLYEIKWNIPIKKKKKRQFPVSLHPPLSHFLPVLPFFFISVFFCTVSFAFFFFWLASGMGKGTVLLKVQWKVDRFVLPITTSPGERAPSISQSLEQTGPVSATLQAQGGSSCFSSAAWTCLTLTQVG